MRSDATYRREFALYRLTRAISARTPFWLLKQLGALLGVLYLLVSSRRRTVLANLQRVFPHRSRAWRLGVACRCAAHYGSIAFDYMKWSMVPEETLLAKVRGRGVENLRDAVAHRKGCFILSAHFGNWEVAALWLASQGFHQTVVIRPLENPLLEAELSSRRTRFGNTLIPKGAATRGMLRTLRGGGIVDILLDQKADLEHSVIVDFLGVPTPTAHSLAKMVLATGAPVVPLFTFPHHAGYEVRLDPPIAVGPGDDVISLTKRYNDCLSRQILERPELWLWFHDRWTPRRRRVQDLTDPK